MNVKTPFFKTRKGLIILGFIIVAIVVIPLSVYFLQQPQIFQPRAWHTVQSANAACGGDGKVVITVKFTNTEAAGAANAINVTVTGAQIATLVDLGKVDPGETKIQAINTSLTSINAGGVTFNLTWSDGHGTPDTRAASYPAVATCEAPVATPTLTPTVTPTLPPEEPTPTPTPIEEPTATPTPISETTTPTEIPPTPTTGVTSTPTTPPQATSTSIPPTDTPQPTSIIVVSRPTIAPSGPGNIFIGVGVAGFILTIIGGLIFILL